MGSESGSAMPQHGSSRMSAGWRLKAALALALAADVTQMVIFPVFIAGAASPPDDLLDLGIAAAMTALLGWHWEFLPSFAVKLLPGADLAPLWTLAVANVYRKERRKALEAAAHAGQQGSR